MRQPGGRIRQNITDYEGLEPAEQIRTDAMLCHIFPKNNQRFDLTGFDVVSDSWQVAADFGESKFS
jgi:hypothetical protein